MHSAMVHVIPNEQCIEQTQGWRRGGGYMDVAVLRLTARSPRERALGRD